jgi:hypothetical protein
MSEQPTHHGYAVNVKDRTLYGDVDTGPLTDDQVQAIYDNHAEDFWHLAGEVAREYGFRDIYSEGRMGGWAVPVPQPATDDMWPAELEAWVRDRFRPLERDLLELVAGVRADFLSDLADAVARAKAEPAERAEWEARGVQTVD